MAIELLTREELQELTGYQQAARIQHWLHTNGWVYAAASRRGEHPRVERAYYLARMTGRPIEGAPRREGPRVDWMLGG